MRFPTSSLTVIGCILLASATSISAQTLNVNTDRTPALSEVPTINLPNQTDTSIGQALTTTEQVDLPTAVEPETITAPRIPTTEITRGVEGTKITSPSDLATPQTAPVNRSEPTKYAVGMILSGTAEVFDGHSFLLENHPVRLNGVDAPGLQQVCTVTGGAAWRCGEASRMFLKRLIHGKRLTCHVDAPAGAGAAVSCSGVGIPDVTRLVIDAGMAVVNGHGRKYLETQMIAQERKAGLWVGKFTSPIEWRRKNK